MAAIIPHPTSNGEGSMSEVLRLSELLEQVLLRVDGLKSFLRSSVMSREWLELASRKELQAKFMANRTPPMVGIIVQFASWHSGWRHLEFASMEFLDHALAPKASEVAAALAGQVDDETILACGDGEVVVRERGSPRGYARRTIFGAISTSHHRLPRDDIIEHLPSAICACFVVIDGDKAFFDGYPQAHAEPGGELGVFRLRVSSLQGDQWVVEVSTPIFPNKPCIPHDEACAIVVEGVLYIMYAVGFLFTYDMESGKVCIADLPAAFSKAKDMDYKLARSGKSGLCILLRRGASLEHWTCVITAEAHEWRLDAIHNLKVIFDGEIHPSFWDATSAGEPQHGPVGDILSMKIRAVGRNGSYAIITFGFRPLIFLVDTVTERAIKIAHIINPHNVMSVTPVCLPWPRSFPRD